jgi:hypothetical protein
MERAVTFLCASVPGKRTLDINRPDFSYLATPCLEIVDKIITRFGVTGHTMVDGEARFSINGGSPEVMIYACDLCSEQINARLVPDLMKRLFYSAFVKYISTKCSLASPNIYITAPDYYNGFDIEASRKVTSLASLINLMSTFYKSAFYKSALNLSNVCEQIIQSTVDHFGNMTASEYAGRRQYSTSRTEHKDVIIYACRLCKSLILDKNLAGCLNTNLSVEYVNSRFYIAFIALIAETFSMYGENPYDHAPRYFGTFESAATNRVSSFDELVRFVADNES